jgi:hypothetical protein
MAKYTNDIIVRTATAAIAKTPAFGIYSPIAPKKSFH